MMNFNKLREIMPKFKEQYITGKLAYLAKTEKQIIIKISRSIFIGLQEDGTYSIYKRRTI